MLKYAGKKWRTVLSSHSGSLIASYLRENTPKIKVRDPYFCTHFECGRMLPFPPKILFCFTKLARFCEMHSLRNAEETFNPNFKFQVAPRELWQPTYHCCQPSCHHTQEAAWRPSSHLTPSPAPMSSSSTGRDGPGSLPLVVAASGNKKVITMKVITMKVITVK